MTPVDFFPNFFLVGAPRCGTTALSKFLNKHEKVCFSNPKEPHFFTEAAGTDLLGTDLERDYLGRCFQDRRPQHVAIGEGSVSYLYSREAIPRILELRPDARFIVNVRDPVDMLRSYHARLLYLLDEDEPDFDKAWALQAARGRGERLPKGCRDPNLLQYADLGRLGEHVERFFEMVPEDQRLVVVFDDWARDPRSVHVRVLEFLGVEDDGRSKFKARRPSKTYRYRWLQRLLYRPPASAIRMATKPGSGRRDDRVKPKRNAIKQLRKRLVRWNTYPQKPPPLSDRMRAELRETFAKDVEKLGRLIDRDLGHWL